MLKSRTLTHPLLPKVYVTKYALTQGILVFTSVELASERLIRIRGNTDTYFHKPEWHTSREEAVAKAEAMRAGKLKSLEKELAKLKGIDFAKDAPL